MRVAHYFYPLLGPLRIFICILSLISLIAIYIGKRLSTANEDLDAAAAKGTILAQDSKKNFQDETQIGLDFAIFFMALYVFFRPQTSYWWAAGQLRRSIVCWTMAGLGAGCASNQLFQILTSGDPVYISAPGGSEQIDISPRGCSAHIYDLTRGRCWIQMGASAAEILWALLVILEGGLWVIQRRDKTWHAQKANFEVQNAVLYQPTITLPTPGESQDGVEDTMELDEIHVVPNTSGQRQHVEDEDVSGSTAPVDEALPTYQYKAPRGQLRIIDATHPPERLTEALEGRLQQGASSGTFPSTASAPEPAPLAHSTTMPPSYTE